MYVYDESANEWIRLSSTPGYRRRKQVLRHSWLAGGLLLLMLPVWLQIILLGFGLFMSFSFLDESNRCTRSD